MAENYKHLYEQMKTMVAMYQDEIVPGMREQLEKRVEVVRCKDCKHIRPEVDAYTQEVVGYWCSFLDLGSIQDEHFCSYGERKDGEG